MRLVEAVLAAAALAGCVSANAPAGKLTDTDDAVVVERSKAQPPAWAAAEPGVLTESPADFRLVTVRSKLLSLPLGLKQAQLAGVEALRAAVGARVKERLLKAAGDQGIAAPARPADLDRVVKGATDEVGGRYAKVADLYFERLEDHGRAPGDPLASYHAAYVLAVFPKDQEGALFDALARRLQAGDAALRPLARAAKSLGRG
jgi:hypothetical protein